MDCPFDTYYPCFLMKIFNKYLAIIFQHEPYKKNIVLLLIIGKEYC